MSEATTSCRLSGIRLRAVRGAKDALTESNRALVAAGILLAGAGVDPAGAALVALRQLVRQHGLALLELDRLAGEPGISAPKA